jgi:hypothetical protein
MGSIYMVTLKSVWLAQQCRNVLYYETQAGEPTDAEWQDIADEVRTTYDAGLDSLMSDEWHTYGIDYRRVDTPGLPTFSKNYTAGILVGSAITDDLPTQIAMLVSIKGATTKPNHARSYLPGMTTGQLEDGQWESIPLQSGANFIGALGSLNSAGTNDLFRVAVTWNSSHTQVVDWNTLVGGIAQASSVPATQRRRRIGQGI